MNISIDRVLRITLILGVIGALAALVRYGWRDALGFLLGAGISYLSFRSFARLAESLGKAPVRGSAIFWSMRYVLIGVAIYATIRVLGSSPGALIVGLLMSFVALILERITQHFYGS